MSTMNVKVSSEGEEEALGRRSKTLGESSRSGDIKKGQVIVAAYVIVTIELTFIFMHMGVMPVSMGYLVSQHALPSVLGNIVFQEGYLEIF